MSDTHGLVDNPVRPLQHKRKRFNIRLVFFSAVFIVMLGYTAMAFQMDWMTVAGRIGPGFFPRIVGALSLIACGWAIFRCLLVDGDRDDEGTEEDEIGEGDLGRHPRIVLVTVVASIGMVVTLNTLGAIVSSGAFLLVMLVLLNRGRWVTNVAVSVAVPIIMYLIFQTALNAGLPSGLLGFF